MSLVFAKKETLEELQNIFSTLEQNVEGMTVDFSGNGPSRRMFLRVDAVGRVSYKGPFLVQKNSTTSVKIGKNRPTLPDVAINGFVTTQWDIESDVSSITETGWVCLKIEDGVYTFEHLTDIDVQNYNTKYIPLAYVVCTASVITAILQTQYGYIHIAGYTGPFALSISSGTATVSAGRATLGQTVNEISLDTVAASVNDYVYYKFTAPNTYVLESGASWPTQDDDYIYVIIGKILTVTSVEQMHNGNIHHAARFIR